MGMTTGGTKMGFIENLHKKIAIQQLATRVMKSLGTEANPRRMDRKAMQELLITMDALRSASARRITAIIPYYSYARSDKKDAPRISITGRLIVLTDTVNIPTEKQFPQLEVISVAGPLAEAVKRIHTGESIGALFN